ncbi:MAG: cytidine deaminase [Bdellovibrionales bacterium GWA2_49_15]|nr:MAG: cytidine deaminase [Bdellovibrionales bacterium GWA2_49_15]HAZ12004.1 cytidine deaminase [Bdellovibrionales bacterium]
MENWIKKAWKVAQDARERAYAPYSKFKVGAALVTKADEMYPGCNVENASFGGTTCAERNAVFHMISKNGVQPIKGLVLITEPMAVPCGLCLQVLSEFAASDFEIHMFDTRGNHSSKTLADFLPNRFDPSSLPKS